MPPQKVEEHVVDLIELVPEITEELLSTVDQPLRIKVCSESGREFLVCDYNRDGDSYRSPFSNTYNPPLADGITPSEPLRKLEVMANEAFDIYRDLFVFFDFLGIMREDYLQSISGTWKTIHSLWLCSLKRQQIHQR